MLSVDRDRAVGDCIDSLRRMTRPGNVHGPAANLSLRMPSDHTGNGLSDAEDLLLESHEDRLQGVERGVAECNRSLTAATVRLDGLGQQVVEGNAAVIERIASGFSSVHRRLDASEAGAKEFSDGQRSQGRDIAELKAKVVGRERWVRRAKSAGIGIILAAFGAVASHFGDAAWAWLTVRK